MIFEQIKNNTYEDCICIIDAINYTNNTTYTDNVRILDCIKMITKIILNHHDSVYLQDTISISVNYVE